LITERSNFTEKLTKYWPTEASKQDITNDQTGSRRSTNIPKADTTM